MTVTPEQIEEASFSTVKRGGYRTEEVDRFLRTLADEHRNSALRSNCVNPGATRTKMRLSAFPGEDRDALKTPEEILAPYMFLLGPDSKGVTGESLNAQ